MSVTSGHALNRRWICIAIPSNECTVVATYRRGDAPSLVELRIRGGCIGSSHRLKAMAEAALPDDDSRASTRRVTSLDVRDVSLGQLDALAAQVNHADLLDAPAAEADLDLVSVGRTRSERTKLLRAVVAVAYERHYFQGARNPTQAVAAQLGMTPAQVRNQVSRARSEGLLSPAEGARPHGIATARAHHLLERARREHPRGERK